MVPNYIRYRPKQHSTLQNKYQLETEPQIKHYRHKKQNMPTLFIEIQRKDASLDSHKKAINQIQLIVNEGSPPLKILYQDPIDHPTNLSNFTLFLIRDGI